MAENHARKKAKPRQNSIKKAPFVERYEIFREINKSKEHAIQMNMRCFMLDSRRLFQALEYADRRDKFRTPKRVNRRPGKLIPNEGTVPDNIETKWQNKSVRRRNRASSNKGCASNQIPISNQYNLFSSEETKAGESRICTPQRKRNSRDKTKSIMEAIKPVKRMSSLIRTVHKIPLISAKKRKTARKVPPCDKRRKKHINPKNNSPKLSTSRSANHDSHSEGSKTDDAQIIPKPAYNEANSQKSFSFSKSNDKTSEDDNEESIDSDIDDTKPVNDENLSTAMCKFCNMPVANDKCHLLRNCTTITQTANKQKFKVKIGGSNVNIFILKRIVAIAEESVKLNLAISKIHLYERQIHSRVQSSKQTRVESPVAEVCKRPGEERLGIRSNGSAPGPFV